MSRVENDPFIAGLDKTMIATILPKRPNSETAVSRMPSVMNPKVVVLSAADLPNPDESRN